MKQFKHIIVALFLACLFLWACSKKELPEPPGATYSKHGDTLSHRNGQVCLTCHIPGGTATISFVVAGSVFQSDKSTPSVNGTLSFWSDQGGTGMLYATLEVDGKGNFYTTSSILPAQGVYPQILGTSGDVKTMPIMTPNGNCNSCHGVTDPPIWVN
ncbi:MAG: hypothetical protein ISR57_02200 [Bacteroidales bacterium]|nr:hypothetical protein [Bacteroidota bacterium]MBL6949432.1 hypothetical protein [Bacteroidales bacterium]